MLTGNPGTLCNTHLINVAPPILVPGSIRLIFSGTIYESKIRILHLIQQLQWDSGATNIFFVDEEKLDACRVLVYFHINI